ncbi:MAG: Spx/MgsR family RNA polymerase-binding regulatory protein [Synechococcaceae cyanobacterium]|nr:Spx/MgsR family RNA polymerase-binding regulatory protein [Synechococcaceae cyanobacterium]
MSAPGDAPPGHRVFATSTCGTCRKARRWLEQQGIAVTWLDIAATPPSPADLRRALEQLGGRGRLFNTSGRSYRALGAAAVKAMDDGQALAALAADGMLIKRPFLITADGAITTGFRQEEWERLLGRVASP